MPICRDPLLTYLNRDGYNVVRRPRAGIAPLDALGQDGGHPEWLGQLQTIWESSTDLPRPGSEEPVASVNLQEDQFVTAELSFAVGSELLDRVLQGLGASLPSVGFALRRRSRFSFRINDPKRLAIDPLEIGKFLADGDLHTENPFVRRYFTNDRARAFVISETLRSRSVTLTATRGVSGEASINAAAVEELLKADGAIEASRTSDEAITFEGPDPVVFGFKSFQIGYLNGEWNVDCAEPSGNLGLLGTVEVGEPYLFYDGQPLNI